LTAHLSQADVARLLKDPSADTRADTARKIAAQLDDRDLTEVQRRLVEDVVRAMVRDAEVRVRKALSDSLKDNPAVPRDVALRLATDEVAVAAPIIEYSEVLTDGDLLDIVRTKAEDFQLAVARRKNVSPSVAEALVETDNETVVAELVGNEGADIGEAIFQKVLDQYGESERINAPMAGRRSLPITVAERLVTLVSDTLRDHLMTHHELSTDLATDLVLQSRERATVGLLSNGASKLDIDELVAQLHANGRLTPSIVLRALCTGDIIFFEESMARLVGISVANVRILIYDEGSLGLRSLCDKSDLPPELFPVARVAIDVVQELEYDGQPGDRERFRDRMIERVLTQFETGFDGDNLEYLVAKLGQRAHA
jgi:uncharacterized protein (DUF2336 family)